MALDVAVRRRASDGRGVAGMTATVFPGLPQSAGAARAWLARHLPGYPLLADAQLLISELVTNSAMHSRSAMEGGTIRVRLVTATSMIRVEVRDDGPFPPASRAAGAAADGRQPRDGGRGLVVVNELASCWGTDGKGLAWFRLDCPVIPAQPDTAGDDGALFAIPAGGAW